MSKFKTGDRVRFDRSTFPVDYGTVIKPYNGFVDTPSWWVKWDSDGITNISEEIWLTLITEESQEESQEEIHEQSSKTKSDGGSSDYYKLEINGNSIEVEDVIYALVGGDFILGNILKACRRMYLDSKGQGKEGIDMEYDKNKIVYFANSFVNRFGGK